MTHLSIKALRHYHEVGLLAPLEVDRHTGYRFYSPEQVETALLIKRFRELEMPLDELRALVSAPDPVRRDALIQSHLARMEQKLDQTRQAVASLRLLLEEQPVCWEERTVPAAPALAITATIAVDDLMSWWSEAFAELYTFLRRREQAAAGPSGGIYSTRLFNEEAGEVMVFVPILHPLLPEGRIVVTELASVRLAVSRYRGRIEDADRVYGSLGRQLHEQGLAGEGPIREYYLERAEDSTDGLWEIEVGWPLTLP